MKFTSYALLFLLACLGCSKSNERGASEALGFEQYKSLADSSYARKDYEGAIPYLDKLVEMDSTNALWYYRRGNSLVSITKYELAIPDLKMAISLNHRLGDSYFLLGFAYAMTTRYDSLAVECFQKALEINPADSTARDFLRVCQRRLA